MKQFFAAKMSISIDLLSAVLIHSIEANFV